MAKMKPRLFPERKLEDIIAENPQFQIDMDTVDALRAKYEESKLYVVKLREARQRLDLETKLKPTKQVEDINWPKEGF